MDWGAWTQSVNGQAVDVEGSLGAQCYGLMKSYMNNVIGIPGEPSTQIGPYPGYAINVWNGYSQNGMSQYFDQVGSNAQAQTGDVAFWGWGSSIAPTSHVAIINRDLGNGNVEVWSQNSPQKYTTLQVLPKSGIVGYFRPKNAVPGVQLAGDFGDTGGGGILPGPGSLGTQDWWQNLFGGLFGAGLGSIVDPHIQQLFLRLFMPSTYIRIMAGIGSLVFLILGIVLIVKDYKRNSTNG